MLTVADAAMAALRRGWSLIPIEPNGKAPLTQNGYHDATNRLHIVAAWLRRWPAMNLAIQPGCSELIVADVDSPAAEAAAARLGLLREPTHTVGSGRRHWPPHHPKHFARARHLYFRAPSPCPFGKVTVNGLELFGTVGYVLMAPSTHPSGGRYTVELDVEPLPFPPEALALVRRRPTEAPAAPPTTRDARKALDCLARLDPGRSDRYADWVGVGMALHHATAGSSAGLDAWREWSRLSAKFDESRDECAAKWATFGAYTGPAVTVASLVAWAKADHGARVATRAERLTREYAA